MSRLQHTLAARRAARRNGETGLALLDVLLGMAIFALIALIAVQSMGLYRQRGYQSQATSAAKDLGLLLSAQFTNNNELPPVGTDTGPPEVTYPDWGPGASPTDVSGIEGANLTTGIEVGRYIVYPDQKSFAFCMIHRTDDGSVDAYAAYHSPSGSITQSETGAPPGSGGNPCDGVS